MNLKYVLDREAHRDLEERYKKKVCQGKIPFVHYDPTTSEYAMDLDPIGAILTDTTRQAIETILEEKGISYVLSSNKVTAKAPLNVVSNVHAELLDLICQENSLVGDPPGNVVFDSGRMRDLLSSNRHWNYWTMLTNYAEFRKDLEYYKIAVSFANSLFEGKKGSVLDVGTKDVFVVLNMFPEGYTKYALDNDFPENLQIPSDIQLVHDNLFTVTLPHQYDIVFCLEVLEHLEDPTKAFERLKSFSKEALIISVPYGSWHESPFDPITEKTVFDWSGGLEPDLETVVTDWGVERYVAGYKV